MADATALDGRPGQDTSPPVGGTDPSPGEPRERLWAGAQGRVLVGVFVLAFLEAFEAMAVSTAMPAVARELHAVGAIALAFSVPLAVSVVARAAAGSSMDRRGPGRGLRLGVGLFVVGLVGAGLAPSMPVFLLARAVQGYATGLTGVGLWVLVGRVFPEQLRARVFSVMAGAWVLPALVGPGIAGLVSELVGWRWVFLSVPPLALASFGLLRGALRRVDEAFAAQRDDEPAAPAQSRGKRPATGRRALAWSLPVSVALLVTSGSGQGRGLVGPALLVAAVAAVVVAAPRLLPVGTWTGRRGLPSTMSARSLVAAGYLGAETYLPLSLVEHRGMSLTTAGLLLTASAVAWSAAAWLGAHAPVLASPARRVRLGAACVVVGAAGSALAVAPDLPLWPVAVLWTLAGFGMGLSNPTFAVMVMDASGPAEQGVNSAAMQTNDVVVQSLVLAVGAAVFAALVAGMPSGAFVVVCGLAVAAATLGLALTARLGPRRREVPLPAV
ncbi:MFS transporter [Luteimicrobium album]|uniref:MFS transporter n=1 Tax=Luteimicrobium album TaxID=1054550 RepID=A0ABQ6HY45_9MICO|nr:MFS transporter [Luteimicrobium album]GMA23425.1 MFS transporter [Luteimicrobium album]